jgi:hypothetical protein
VGPSGQAGKRKRGSAWFRVQFNWAGSVGPTRLGSAHGLARPAAQQAGSGSGLARRVGWLGSNPSRAGFFSSMGRTRCFAFSSSRPGDSWSSPSLTGWSHVSASAGSDVAGFGSGAADRCACVRVGAVACMRVRAPKGCSGKGPKDLAATRTRHRGHVAGWTRMARPWRRRGAASKEAGTAGSRGKGAHAHAGVLAS